MIRKILDEPSFITSKWEYVIPALVTASLLVSSIIVSSKKFFWNDELYSYYLLSDQSFLHMLGAFHDKINTTPPLYFVVGWSWAKIFGSSELSLRLFSSLGMCLAFILLWITLRRTYNFWSTTIGTIAVFSTSNLILVQNAEARMYGLFLAVCALSLLQFDINNKKSRVSLGTILSNVFIHIALVQTHLYGLFYSGAFVFLQIVRDGYFKVFRPRLYLALVLSWLSLIIYIPSFLNHADAGNPRGWIPIPTLKDLIDFMTLSSSQFFKPSILVWLILLTVPYYIILYRNSSISQSTLTVQNERQHIDTEISLLMFAMVFLAVPIFVWIISRTIKPIFFDRYLIPTALSWSILLTHLFSRVIVFKEGYSGNLSLSKRLVALGIRIPLAVGVVILLISPVSYAMNFRREQPPGSFDNQHGYSNLPIVVQSSHQFLQRIQYSPERARYFFILDWQAAVDETSGQFGPQEYKHLEALKRNYPDLFQDNIVESDDYLDQFDRFLVLDSPEYDKACPLGVKGLEKAVRWEDMHCPRWLEMRILNNPHYKVTPLDEIYGLRLLLVENRE